MKKKLLTLLIVLVAFAGHSFGQGVATEKVKEEVPPVTLKFVSMRFMDKEEGFKKSGYYETDLAVRLRLETSANSYQKLLTFPYGISPSGFNIEKRNGQNIWYPSIKLGELKASPGANYFLDQPTLGRSIWIGFHSSSAIEWEIYYSTEDMGGKLKAHSVFVKDIDGKVSEIVSDFYEIPVKKP